MQVIEKAGRVPGNRGQVYNEPALQPVQCGAPTVIWVSTLPQEGMTDSINSILIIEGEPALRKELASALTKAGFVVADVPDILKANEIRELNPDIAIVDEVLPSGDGKDACSQLHNVFGIPVILLGKESSGEAWMAAVQAGADFYFTKPSHHQELVARVKAILRRYKEAPV